MRLRLLAAVGLVLATVLVLPSGTRASHDPSGEPFGEDSVVGSFLTTAGLLFTIDVHSGPSGESPTGDVTVSDGRSEAMGDVICLHVAGNRATIGLEFPAGIGDGFFFVEDNNGSSQDRFGGLASPPGPPPSDCATAPPPTLAPISRGDITVHDAPPLPTSKEQCKNGGWRSYGTTFKNQGDCVSFVATGGKNPPAG